MASILITNLTAEAVSIGDLYTSVPASGTLTVQRPATALAAMPSLQKAIADGKVAAAVTYDAWETASGLLTPPAATDAADAAPVAAGDTAALEQTIRKAFTAGTPGTADDVIIYAVNTLPYKMRIMDAVANISTAIARATADVRSQAAGAGTLVCSLDAATTGRKEMATPSVVLTPGASVGLYIRRSDRGIAGEVVLTVRRES